MEKAKAFFLICAGVLMLVSASRLVTSPARADFDLGAIGPIVGFRSSTCVLLDTGEVWFVINELNGEPPYWYHLTESTPPIPLEEIQFWSPDGFISTSGDLWYLNGYAPGGIEWVNMGTPPGTAAQSSNWSQLKGSYGK